MKLAFVIFDNMTALDFIGLYDPLTRLKSMGFLPELRWDICAFTETVTDDRGLKFMPTKYQAPFEGYDWLVVPGGNGTQKLQHDAAVMAWLHTARGCPLKVSVCTGSLLLGAAGYLQGKAATTHPKFFEVLKPYCAEVLDQRVVESGDVITGRGVTSAIDLGLYLCEKVAGEAVTEQIRTQKDYPYRWQVTSASWLPPASASASLPLPAAGEAWRSASVGSARARPALESDVWKALSVILLQWMNAGKGDMP